MTRLRRLLPHELDANQREVYASVALGKRSAGPRLFEIVAADGGLLGPFNAMLVQPHLGMATQRVGELLRYGTSLADHVREAVILCVAAEWQSEFEWYAHAAVARHAGLPESLITTVRGRESAIEAAPEVRLALTLADLVLRRDGIPDDVYGDALATFGEPGIVELVTLVGYYSLLAGLLHVFEVTVPEGTERQFPNE